MQSCSNPTVSLYRQNLGGKHTYLHKCILTDVTLNHPHWSVIKLCVGKNTRNSVQYFLTLVLFTFCTCILRCLMCIVVVVLCVLLSSYVYLLYYVCIAVFTLDAGLLAISQYSEGTATGHLDTGVSWFPCVYKQMLR